MAESVVLVAKPREGRGSQAAKRLRKQGLVPGILYGHKEANVALSLSGEELHKAVRHGVRVVDLQADGKEEKALIKDIQWDYLGKEILHVDFARVSLDERIVVTVPVELRGTAPGVNAGGVLDQPIHTLSVECLAIRIPESIRVPIGELQLGGSIYVRDLVLPEGVKVMDDPDAIVVHVTTPAAEPEAAPPTEAPEGAEPEVISSKKKTEEEEAE